MSATKLMLGIAILAGAIALLKTGAYGYAIFVLIPLLIGAMAAMVFHPANAKQAAAVGSLAIVIPMSLTLLLGLEGLICLAMALPLAVPLGMLGSWLVYKADSAKAANTGLAMAILLTPAGVLWDLNATPELFAVHSSVEIAASPEQVWKHVVTFSDIPEPTDWIFRAGLAYPRRARIEGTGVGAVRYCEFSTGPFVEPIEVWDEPRLLRFSVAANPAPLREWSPYGELVTRHLHGYFASRQGEFRLTQLGPRRTLLEGTTWYRHGLWPSTYWRWWSDAIIHQIHMRVLTHIKTLAEQGRATGLVTQNGDTKW